MITRSTHTKSKFVGLRLTPAEQEKVLTLSLLTPAPGNISEAIRQLIAKAPEVRVDTGQQLSERQPERAMVAA